MDKPKKIILIIAGALALTAFAARAQGVTSPATSEVNLRGALWWDTDNSAALALRPIGLYGDLFGVYTRDDGDLRRSTEAGSSDIFSVKTSGGSKVGRTILWGEFSISDIFEREVKHNALCYEIPEDMPYFLADTVASSRWNKQDYSMRARISSPVFWDRLSFGVDLSYTDRVAAKQRDPRAQSKLYSLSLTPSVAWKIDSRNILGLSGSYGQGFERSEPSNREHNFNQGVFITRGLGMGAAGTVGGLYGLGTFYYKRKSYGAGVQYGFSSGSFDLLAEAKLNKRDVDVFEQPTMPRRRGSTESTVIEGALKLLWGESGANKLTLDGMYRTTDGLEHQQQYVNETRNQRWETIVSNNMSSYDRTSVSAGYSHLFGAGKPEGYSAKAGARAAWDNEDDSYHPTSKWNWSGVSGEVNGGVQLCKGKSALLAEASLLYNKNLSGEYVFGGPADNAPVCKIYEEELRYRCFDYLCGKVALSYTLHGRKINYVWSADCSMYRSVGDAHVPDGWDTSGSADRTLAHVSFGIIF